MKAWIIVDWAGNYPFNKYNKNGPGVTSDISFETFEDGEEFLSEFLGDNYETDRQEYYVIPRH
jgi:hypothetical protein